MSRQPLLVRVGVSYFRSLSRKAGKIDVGDGVHYLNPDERAALRRVQRGAVTRAALAGATSTVIAGTTELLAHPLLGPRPRFATLTQTATYWAVVGGVTVIAAIGEIGFLYWDGLRSVHRLAREAGLDLFPDESDEAALAGAMARAALELPNPTGELFGVNPYREASRFRLLVASLVYKAKVTVTNFTIKALVRRSLGRAVVRAWLPFVAVPITATWNAVVCWLIMRQARIRAMGPSAIREMMDIVFEGTPEALRPQARAAAVRAVASSIVRTEDMHPNLRALLEEVIERSGVASRRNPEARIVTEDNGGDLDDPFAFLDRLAVLTQAEQRIVLRVLSVAAIMDGKITRAERKLLVEARRTCGLPAGLDDVERLRRAFLDGDAIDPAIIARL